MKLSYKEEEKNIDALEVVGDIIIEHIRTNDYFGKLSENEYVIVTSNTSLGGAVTFAEKISQQFASEDIVHSSMKYFFRATQADEIDNMEAIIEKLQEALSRTIQSGTHIIEIEI